MVFLFLTSLSILLRSIHVAVNGSTLFHSFFMTELYSIVCICVCMYVYIYMYVYICVCVCVCVYIYIYIYVSIPLLMDFFSFFPLVCFYVLTSLNSAAVNTEVRVSFRISLGIFQQQNCWIICYMLVLQVRLYVSFIFSFFSEPPYCFPQ